MNVSLIIPAHNEAERLAETLDRYGGAFQERFGNGFEFIVVANCCTDETAQIARDYAVARPDLNLRVIEIAEAIGKGGAVLEGFRHAQGQRIAFADADGATAPESLVQLIRQLDHHDIVIGSRRVPTSVILKQQPLRRRIMSRVFAAGVRLLLGVRYWDTQCGAKAFRRRDARRLLDVVDETRWAFDVDLLLGAQELGLRVKEQGVLWADQAGSQLHMRRILPEVLSSLWRMKRRHGSGLRRGGHPQSPSDRPLRILALNWRCLKHPQAGGSEINLFEQAKHWVAAGHEVMVVCARTGRACAEPEHELVHGILVRRMGGHFSIYPLVALFLLRYGRRFDRVLDIANGIPFFSPLFTRTPSVLLVHHVHDRQWFAEFPLPVAVIGRYIERRVVPWLYRGLPTIAVSETTKEALERTGFLPSQIEIVYNGIEHPEVMPEVRPEPHRIAYVGRIKRYKRVDRLVHAVAALRSQFSDIHLDIAGDGDARSAVVELIERLRLQEHVTVHGFVDEETKSEILGRASIFATPSMHEGWGLSVIEANAHGCPAVAYDVPGLCVAIRDGETGLLAGDDEGFRDALGLLLREDRMRRRMARNAQQWAARFDWGTSAQKTLQVMEQSAVPRIQG